MGRRERLAWCVAALFIMACGEPALSDAGAPTDAGPDAPFFDGGGPDAGFDAPDAPLPEGFIPLPNCRTPEVFVVGDAAPSVSIVAFGYTPRCLIVPVGATVRMEAAEFHPLGPSMLGTPGNPIPAGAVAPTDVRFDAPGFFPYFCANHGTERGGMAGVVQVIPD